MAIAPDAELARFIEALRHAAQALIEEKPPALRNDKHAAQALSSFISRVRT
jgi:hypothetical protein